MAVFLGGLVGERLRRGGESESARAPRESFIGDKCAWRGRCCEWPRAWPGRRQGSEFRGEDGRGMRIGGWAQKRLKWQGGACEQGGSERPCCSLFSLPHASPSSVLASRPPLPVGGGGHARDLPLPLLLLPLPQSFKRNQGRRSRRDRTGCLLRGRRLPGYAGGWTGEGLGHVWRRRATGGLSW